MRHSEKTIYRRQQQKKPVEKVNPILSRRSLLIGGLIVAGGSAVAAALKWCGDSTPEKNNPSLKPFIPENPENPKIERDRRACADYFKALDLFLETYARHLRQKLAPVYAKAIDEALSFAFQNKSSPTFQESLEKKPADTIDKFFCGSLEQHEEMPKNADWRPGAMYVSDQAGLLVSDNMDSSNVIHQLAALHETLHALDCHKNSLTPLPNQDYFKPLQLELRAYALMIEYINAYTGGVLRRAILSKQKFEIIASRLSHIFRLPEEYTAVSKSLMGMIVTLVPLAQAYYDGYKEGEFSERFVKAIYANEKKIGVAAGFFDAESGTVNPLTEDGLQNAYNSNLRRFALK